MPCKRLLCAAALAAAAACLLSASPAAAKTIELKNDSLADNSEGKAICGFSVGEGFGVRFSPPAFPAKLLKVRVLMTNVGLSLEQCNKVAVADQLPIGLEISHMTGAAPGTSLLALTELGISNDTILNEFDLSPEKLSIDDGAFFVAFTLQDGMASPMIDQGATVGDGNYVYGDVGQGLKWYTFGALGANAPNGNWAVRAVVEVPDDDAGAAGAPGDAGADGPSSAGDAGGAIGVDAAQEAGALPPPQAAEGGGCRLAARGQRSALAMSVAALALLLARRRRRS
jgi:hypothetical protein